MDICRGVGRLLNAHGFASITEVTLANGRRADVVGVGTSGEIWIVEVKSCAVDFKSDQKWFDYLPSAIASILPWRLTFPPDCSRPMLGTLWLTASAETLRGTRRRCACLVHGARP